MTRLLEGRTVSLAEGRQLEELAQMLEKEGARTLRCPMVSILDAPDRQPVLDWLHELIAGRYDYVIIMTGEAVRRLVCFAEQDGVRDPFIAALGRTRLVTRGPKPVRALGELALKPALVAETPTTDGVIATLQKEVLQGQTVGVTLYGGPNPRLVDFLEHAGAEVRTVLSYVFAPDSEAESVVHLMEAMAGGAVDAIIFTSSPQVDRLFDVARQHRREATLKEGLKKTCVAAVGPIVAQTLHEKGVQVHVCPEQGFVMKNVVQHLKRELGAPGS